MRFKPCISRINITQVDGAHNIDIVMQMYNLIENSDNYSKTSGILWEYYRDKPAVNAANGNIVDFNADNDTTDLFKIEEEATGETGDDSI